MRIAFLYNRAAEDPTCESDDEIPARSPVVAALRRLGHDVRPVACTLNLASVRRRLDRAKPDVVFNRVESLGGSDAMMPAVTLLLDAMQLPYTGCPTAAIVATASKVSTKQRLLTTGLPTPAWVGNDCEFQCEAGILKQPGARARPSLSNASTPTKARFILKAVHEHASFEMDDSSVIESTTVESVVELLQMREAETGRPYFAEQFVEGREFNLSLIGDPPEVLPPAEIDFSAFPVGKPRIVGHSAKCDSASFEYDHTPRQFDFPAADEPLVRRLRELALECWQLFGLRGYARVDFRVDATGAPWILEINTNPCIMPHAGFAAALEHAGIGYDGGLQRIIDDALARRFANGSSATRVGAELII